MLTTFTVGGSNYRRLSVADKQRETRYRARPPAMRCPECGLALLPRDMLKHLADRCEGREPAHPSERWISRGDVAALGVCERNVERWAALGLVRYLDAEDGAGRRYLLRDVVLEVALRMRRKRLTAACR